MQQNSQKTVHGFTLIEILIVIAIIGIISVVAFVALDPARRFKESRDAARWTDATAVLDAVKVNQVDNKGVYLATINSASAATDYMIAKAVVGAGCDDSCTQVDHDTYCLDLQGFVTGGYLAALPVSPKSTGSWTANTTGYYLNKATNGSVTVGACEAEAVTAITVSR